MKTRENKDFEILSIDQTFQSIEGNVTKSANIKISRPMILNIYELLKQKKEEIKEFLEKYNSSDPIDLSVQFKKPFQEYVRLDELCDQLKDLLIVK